MREKTNENKSRRRYARQTFMPKGRQVDQQQKEEIHELLGNGELRRDLLIEYLHVIQDRFRCLYSDHLVALASLMGIALSEIFETATFYAHFDIVIEDENCPPPITVRVCDSLTCEMFGAQELISSLSDDVSPAVRVLRAPCMGRCDTAPVAEVGHCHVDNATVDQIKSAIDNGEVHPVVPKYQDFDAYRAEGGYRLLEQCLSAERTPDELVSILQDSPASRSWRCGISDRAEVENRARIFRHSTHGSQCR